jgi:hypothetical protein
VHEDDRLALATLPVADLALRKFDFLAADHPGLLVMGRTVRRPALVVTYK